MSGERLMTFIRSIHRLQYLQQRLAQRLDMKILKLLIETGKMTSAMMRKQDVLADRLDILQQAFKASSRADETLITQMHEDAEQGNYWVQFERRDHGRMMMSRLYPNLLATAEFAEAQKLCTMIQSTMQEGAYVAQDDKRWATPHYDDLTQMIVKEGRKGLNIQRYKGLGEMNPEQLWETTMDASVRSMLQVTLEDVVNADETFSMLMGDAVEPRRNFIQDNALKVRNLDV